MTEKEELKSILKTLKTMQKLTRGEKFQSCMDVIICLITFLIGLLEKDEDFS
jgi:hypothetical protein